MKMKTKKIDKRIRKLIRMLKKLGYTFNSEYEVKSNGGTNFTVHSYAKLLGNYKVEYNQIYLREDGMIYQRKYLIDNTPN